MCNKMAKPKEKIEEEFNNSEEEEFESDDEEEEMDENVGKVINVAFDARPPSNSDFHGIKRLLNQLFVKELNEEISELCDVIIGQDFIGSVLKQDYGSESEEEDEEDGDDDDDRDNVYGVCTVVNLSENQNLSCIEKVGEFLSSKCEGSFKGEPSRLSKLLSDPTKQVGLLLCERFIDIPAQVALPSFESLKSDMERAVRKKKKFDFTHLILISKAYRAKGQDLNAETFYSNPEEELFMDISDFNFTYSVATQRDSVTDGDWDEEESMEALRTVMVFDASSLPHLIEKLKQEVTPA